MKNEKCKTCQGYGMWAFGMYTSMGRGDSHTFPTLPCPECGANANPLPDKKKKGIGGREW